MKTFLKFLRTVAGIWFALVAAFGMTRIAIAGSFISFYAYGVYTATAVSWVCLRPMTTVLRVTRIVVGIWFALCAAGGFVLLCLSDSKLVTSGPVRDVLVLACLAYACLQPEGKALAEKVRLRLSRGGKLSQASENAGREG